VLFFLYGRSFVDPIAAPTRILRQLQLGVKVDQPIVPVISVIVPSFLSFVANNSACGLSGQRSMVREHSIYIRLFQKRQTAALAHDKPPPNRPPTAGPTRLPPAKHAGTERARFRQQLATDLDKARGVLDVGPFHLTSPT
jgi:hypothetical protein